MRASQRLVRLLTILVLGGFTLGVCLVALGPGVSKIAASAHYTGTVAPALRPLEGPTTLYDADGNVMDRLGDLDRTPVDLNEVPKTLISAVVATEDHTFFDNPGVDVRSSFRAFLSNVGSGGIGQGGSTITQQLIKNRYFTNPKRDLDRKIREAILAARLTGEWSKRRILQEYLNTVYFGANAYGVQAAAQRIIGVPLAQLDLAQSALLAGVIKDPINFDPFTHPEAAIRRRIQVLRAMQHQKKITASEAAYAAASPLPTRPDCNAAPNDPKCLSLAAALLVLGGGQEPSPRAQGARPRREDRGAAGIRRRSARVHRLPAGGAGEGPGRGRQHRRSVRTDLRGGDGGDEPPHGRGAGDRQRHRSRLPRAGSRDDGTGDVPGPLRRVDLQADHAGHRDRERVLTQGHRRRRLAVLHQVRRRHSRPTRVPALVQHRHGAAGSQVHQLERRQRRHRHPVQPDQEQRELRLPEPVHERRSAEGRRDGDYASA